MIETIILYKLPRLSREEIQAMLQVHDIRQTRVYQEAVQEGIEKGRRETIREILEDQFGPLSPQTEARLQALPVEDLASLRKAIPRAASLKDLGLENGTE
jgi:predicted transposase YdaD